MSRKGLFFGGSKIWLIYYRVLFSVHKREKSKARNWKHDRLSAGVTRSLIWFCPTPHFLVKLNLSSNNLYFLWSPVIVFSRVYSEFCKHWFLICVKDPRFRGFQIYQSIVEILKWLVFKWKLRNALCGRFSVLFSREIIFLVLLNIVHKTISC